MQGDEDPAAALFCFIMASSRLFHIDNSWFDNRKLAAYRNVCDLIDHPAVFASFDAANAASIDGWAPPGAFVLKADSGHSARLVWPLEACANGMWTDRLRGDEHDVASIRDLAHAAVSGSRAGCAFAEALLLVGGALARDYKFYVADGRCKIVLVGARSMDGLKVKFFDRDLKPIALGELFAGADVAELDAVDLPDPAGIARLMSLSEQLAHRHKARFCRYDFLQGEAGFVFGEISPICGGMLYWHPTKLAASLLMPDAKDWGAMVYSRERFRQHVRAQAVAWIKTHSAIERTALDAYKSFLDVSDGPGADFSLAMFLEAANEAGAAWAGRKD